MRLGLVSAERLLARTPLATVTTASALPLRDLLLRPLTDLRMSVTDRCNFRCSYCMPASAPAETRATGLLDFDELTRIAATFVELGVRKLRITGGEPLVRRDLPTLIARLARLPIRDLCMTTNGSLLSRHAEALVAAGLKRVTVSLDAIDELTFRRITRGRTSLKTVLGGIEAARRSGLAPVKINMVVQRGINDHAILDMASWARREGLELRFIEYMDVGCTNGWRIEDVVTAAEILETLQQRWPLVSDASSRGDAPAERFHYRDGAGVVGFVASISQPFCGACSRARITAAGQLHSCLFAESAMDLGRVMRDGGDVANAITRWWQSRSDRYSELRARIAAPQRRPEMSMVGG